MSRFLILLCLLYSIPAKADPCTFAGWCGFHPYMPVTGPGPFVNFGQGDGTANLNAAIHISLAVGIPLIGQQIGGKKGKQIAGWTWIAFSLLQEALFHSPKTPDKFYGSEVRSDLITRIVPTLIVLSF